MSAWSARIFTTLRAVLRWWLGELVGLVPPGTRQRISRLRGRLLLVLGDDGAELVYEAGERRETLGRTERFRDGAEIAAVLRGRGAGGADVVVSLPAQWALRSAVALPLAAESNLDQVLRFEFERLAPFKSDEVYYAARTLRRDGAARRLHLELTIVPHERARGALQEARRLDLRVVGLVVAGDRSDSSPNLLPPDERPSSGRVMRLALAGASGLCLVLGMAAIIIPMVRLEARIDTLSRQIEAAKQQAQASQALQKQIETQRDDAQLLVNRKRQTPSVTETLAALTHLVPDDSWLTTLQISGAQIRMSGYSPSATSLLSLLDQSGSFAEPTFASSVTQDSATKRERFDLGARIVSRERR
jgi:general secretion pathway protein L